VRLLARVIGIGIETADMLVQEILSRKLRDRRAVARYAWAHGIARRERFETPREGPGQGRQCAGTTWADPVGVALPDVPERTVRWRSGIARGLTLGLHGHLCSAWQ